MAAVQQGSFEGASKQLFITPAAVSLRIQALEEKLGCILVQRTRPCRVTDAGQKLLKYLRTNQRLQQDLFDSLSGISAQKMQKVVIASNADSLATWLLPNLEQTFREHNIVAEIQLDDQAQTHHLLKSGAVNACISAENISLQGCESVYLGKMRYQLVATQAFIDSWFMCDGGMTLNRQQLTQAPAVIFNEKDKLHFDYLEQHFGLVAGSYPYHTVPSSDSFISAIALGLGYGFVPELQLTANLVRHKSVNHELINAKDEKIHNKESSLTLLDKYIDVPLYWHHWKQQSKALELITKTLIHKSTNYLKQE